MESKIHKVFVSYHRAKDQTYMKRFEKILLSAGISVLKSVRMRNLESGLPVGTIRELIRDEYLYDSAVTFVLIGSETWKLKQVDWEISSSLQDTKKSSRSGLVGILLPTYMRSDIATYDTYTIPPRLHANLKVNCGFAKIYNWNENPVTIQKWILEALERRNKVNPDNSYPGYDTNKCGECWQYSA